MTIVPCNGCRACCQDEPTIVLFPERGDFIPADAVPSHVEGRLRLPHKANGDCARLGPDGCTIHDRAPHICKNFDCRMAYKAIDDRPRKIRRAMISQHPKVFEAGRVRLNTLGDPK